ncbi:MAG TPA: methyltransferase domain-containing protein [Caulobacteraceae bacterium]|jgi:SAM-dependent methyltransferase
MRRDVLDLREFYAGPLGKAAREMVSRKVAEAWGRLADLDLLACGYATPFLAPDGARRTIAAMPAQQGVEAWPLGAPNSAALVDETALPFANALFDRVLAVHALEESDSPLAALRELGRVLSPSGRLILVVAARHGLWANAESSPFGHGRPYSRRQLEALVREAELEPAGWTRALYAPPFAWAARWAEGFEQVGARLWPPMAGLILMEAHKPTLALRPIPVRPRVRVFSPGALRPA